MENIEIPSDTCPQAPTTRMTVQTRVLHRACQKAGGVQRLAQQLRVSEALVYRWLEGEAVPPQSIFLQAVDLVMPEWGPEDTAYAGSLRKPNA